MESRGSRCCLALICTKQQQGVPIPSMDLTGCLRRRCIRCTWHEAKRERLGDEGLKVRPDPPGGYLGLGSQIWTYVVLAHWGLDGGDGLQRARKLADQIPAAAAVDDVHDLLSGSAGAIVPLLTLAGKTGDKNYVSIASQLGDLLHERAKHQNGQAYWPDTLSPEGMGGFAHGVTGIGWALTQLARATGSARYEQLAQEAFAFEDALFDEQEQNWLTCASSKAPRP